MNWDLPENPGVYLFKDKTGKILYVGKALNIKKRVRDHFNLKSVTTKEKSLIDRTVRADTFQVDSEIEALLLEANLIKKFRPVFNSQLKDDKDFLYIKITNETFPKVLPARRRDLENAKTYFGPFPSASKVRTTLKSLRRIFPYSTCKPNQRRPCLAYHLELCPGVCAGKIDEKEYRENIQSIRLFLQGKKQQLLNKMQKKIRLLAKGLKFEQASEIQTKLDSFRYITKPLRGISDYLDHDIETIRERETKELTEILKLKKTPNRIECYDVSNIYGHQAVGSMVVFIRGQSDKDEYRRFKIKRTSGINDTAMLAEVLERRFNNSWEKPDLIVVDGGRPQLNKSYNLLQRLGLNIPVISLAKRNEEIYVDSKSKPIKLPAESNALKLVQRLRDEAHRFAITYHRNLRNREFLIVK